MTLIILESQCDANFNHEMFCNRQLRASVPAVVKSTHTWGYNTFVTEVCPDVRNYTVVVSKSH